MVFSKISSYIFSGLTPLYWTIPAKNWVETDMPFKNIELDVLLKIRIKLTIVTLIEAFFIIQTI